MGNSWLKYEELVALRTTSEKYRPSITAKPTSKVADRKNTLKAETVRSHIRCSSGACGKLRCIYSTAALDADAQRELVAALEDVRYSCGSHLLPLDHPLATRSKPVIVDDQLSCAAPMEVYYYHDNRPKLLLPARIEWPVVCYHCGSTNAEVDQEMTDSDMYAMVLPICSPCRETGKRVKTTDPSKAGNKKCSAPSGKKRDAEAAELRQAGWAANKRPVPERDGGEDIIIAVVGKQKQGNKKFVRWGKKDGALYDADTCTWQSIDAAIDKDDVQGKARQSAFTGTIERQADGGGSKYWVKFDSSRHTDRYIDLELPEAVGAGGYSWWRLDGYDTNEEEESIEEHEAEENGVHE